MWWAVACLAAVLPSTAGTGTVEDRAALTAALRPHLHFHGVLLPAYQCRRKSQTLPTRGVAELVRYQKQLSAAMLQAAAPLVDWCSGEGCGHTSRGRPRFWPRRSSRTTQPVLAVVPNTRDIVAQRKCLLEHGRMSSWNVLAWLTFINAKDDVDDIFKGEIIEVDRKVVVAQDAGSETRLLEVYRTSLHRPLHKLQLAVWRDGRLSWTAKGRFSRSSDLQGMVWNCSTARSWPLTVPSIKDDRVVIDGYIGAVWTVLERQLNFSTRCTLWDSDGPFDFERLMYAEKMDVGLRDIMPFSHTLESASITHPVCMVTIGIVMGRPHWQPLTWFSFLQPFCWELWLGLVTTAAAVVACLLLLHSADCHTTQPLADAVFAVISAMVQQAPPSGRPQRAWQRLLLVSVHLTVTAVSAGYSAALVSFLASRDGWPLGADFQHMVLRRGFTLHIVSGAKEGVFVMDSMHPQLAALRHGPLMESGPGREALHETLQSALVEACSRPDQAVVTRLELAAAEAMQVAAGCRLTAVPGLSVTLPIVLPLRRRSPHLPIINHKITALRESGVLSRMRRRYQALGVPAGLGEGHGPPRVDRPEPVVAHGFESVALRNAAPLFAGYCLAVVLAACLLLAELLWGRADARRRRLRGVRGRRRPNHGRQLHRQFPL